MQRYLRPCPACGAILRPGDAKRYDDNFLCPFCLQTMKYAPKHQLAIWVVSAVMASLGAWHFGFGGILLIAVATGSMLVLCAIGYFLMLIVDPPGYKRVPDTSSDRFTPSLSIR